MDAYEDDSVVEGVARDGSRMKWFRWKILGKGSYGVVHKVKPANSHSQVFAVKSCLYEASSSLQKELQILKGFIGCPTVVQCYGDMLSVERGLKVYNLFLEFAAGGTLLDLIIKKGSKIPESDARRFARMLVKGVRDIHLRGYVHCDLKPANILVYPPEDYYGEVDSLKIADFGLARLHGEILEKRVEECGWKLRFPGTAVYMPPEAVNAAKIETSLDIWSLGCLVLQMITGKLPWEFGNMTELAMKLVCSRDTPKIPKGVSREGVDFLMKCFARNPAERWTAEMLLRHPFLNQDCPSLPSEPNFLHHAEAIYAMLCS